MSEPVATRLVSLGPPPPLLPLGPDDEATRADIASRLDETLFVEAGAGAGKTTALVERFVATVEAGMPARHIAAITFTEKAAAELRDRVRQRLEELAPGSSRCRAALDELDAAAIATLHGFAQRILTEHPVEAGLPPRVEVLDEIGSQLAFKERWELFCDRLLDDPALERPLLLGLALGIGLDQLRDVAVAFNDNWDLVAERVDLEPPDPPPVEVAELCRELEALCDQRRHCRAGDDRLVARIDELATYAEDLRLAPDEPSRLELLRRDQPRFAVGTVGRRRNWNGGTVDLQWLRDRVVEVGERRDRLASRVAEACLRRLAAEVARFTLAAADDRRREARLEFHDLLVQARALLRHPRHGPAVRAALHDRYRRLLLDEFQDTDPIQVELAVLIAAADPEAPEAAGRPWWDVEPEPGRLFFVGDPKQSIYRFRRADIGVFLRARQAFAARAHALTANFRTVAPLLDWVNRTFARIIRAEPGSQPNYVPLVPTRPQPPEGPPVALLGREHADDPNADELREREARGVVAALRLVVEEGWSVSDGLDRHGGERWRRARLGDVCILLPSRTSLPILQRALQEAGIPYRAETTSLVYGTPEVRDLMAVLRAVDDPTDQLSLVTALRSAAFGCGDDDLYTFRVVHGGRWHHQAPLPEGLPPDHPVGSALAWLGRLHGQRLWLSPSEVLDRIVRDRRLMELGFAQGRPRDLWRRLRFVVDQARAWEEARGGSLREYLSWVQLQSAESARVAETVLPETDDDSVRIMTVHGAKGLEFPIVVLSGMTTQVRGRRAGVKVVFPPEGSYGLKLAANLTTAEFDAFAPVDEQMDVHEKQRLLYVAVTRARDHLVVSTHRKRRSVEPDSPAKLTGAELLWRAGGAEPDLVRYLDPLAPALTRPSPGAPSDDHSDGGPPLSREEWAAERVRALSESGRPRALSASAIAERVAAEAVGDPGLEKEARDLDLAPWHKGRYGTAIGRAVHAVLQTVDLATGEGLASAGAAQAAAEGVLGKEEVVAALAGAALASSTVREAVGHEHWREMYVAAPVEDTLVEGYLDLMYRTPEGLVVVDYKTDAVADADLGARVARYRLQGAAYALAVQLATGERVARCVFVFLSPEGARERALLDLEAAMAEVRVAVAAPAADYRPGDREQGQMT